MTIEEKKKIMLHALRIWKHIKENQRREEARDPDGLPIRDKEGRIISTEVNQEIPRG